MSELAEPAQGKLARSGQAVVDKILHVGIDGTGPFKGAAAVADETLESCRGDVDRAIDRAIRTHIRLAGASGFTTGGPCPQFVDTGVDYAAGRSIAALSFS